MCQIENGAQALTSERCRDVVFFSISLNKFFMPNRTYITIGKFEKKLQRAYTISKFVLTNSLDSEQKSQSLVDGLQ